MQFQPTLAMLAGAVLAAALAIAGTTAEPLRRGPQPEPSAALQLARAGDAARVEAVLADPGQARPARRAVADVLILLTAESGGIDGALQLMNGVPGSARLFRARLVAVAGGRLYAHATARCGGWQNDLSTCRVACDGGVFALKRVGGDEPRFSLLLGAAAAGDLIEEASAGVLLSACERDGGPEVRLVPAGAAASATLDLLRN